MCDSVHKHCVTLCNLLTLHQATLYQFIKGILWKNEMGKAHNLVSQCLTVYFTEFLRVFFNFKSKNVHCVTLCFNTVQLCVTYWF